MPARPDHLSPMQPYTVPSERFQVDYQEPTYVAEQHIANAYTVPFDYGEVSWPMNYSYVDPEFASYQSAGMHHEEVANSAIPLHAPIPVSGYSSLLASTTGAADELPFSSPSYVPPPEESKPNVGEETSPLDVYLHSPQVFFPTPSELLTDLNAREREARSGSEASGKAPPKTSPRSAARSAKAEVEEPENLNQRKAYFRSVSDNVGFMITDPDTITSHDKKRCYLECLEEYVQWMHEQLRLVGQEPLPLERVSSYRGLKSRSIRTMLVRKQEDIGKLNQHKLREEQKFMDLQNAVLMRQMAEESLHTRRHSVAMGGPIPDMAHGYTRDGR